MPYKYSKDTDKHISWVAYYQIIGGIIGILMLIYALLNSGTINIAHALFLIALVLFLFSIYCGKLLLDGNTRKGLKLSLVNQAMQVIHFSIVGYSLHYVAGVAISPGINLTTDFNIGLRFWLSMFECKWNMNANIVYVEINLISVYLIYAIQKLQNRIERVSDFGS